MEFSPPLTQFDIVMGVLRVQLWLSVIALVGSLMTLLSLFNGGGMSVLNLLQPLALDGGAILLLLLFPGVLAANSLGATARNTVTSLADVRRLVGRCVGLFLFVRTLPSVVITVAYLIFSALTRPGVPPWVTMFGPTNGTMFPYIFISNILIPSLSFIVSFFLAFGPAIRDNFRSS